MQTPHLFWPEDRKLFRRRSRLRALLPAVLLASLAGLLLTLGHLGIG